MLRGIRFSLIRTEIQLHLYLSFLDTLYASLFMWEFKRVGIAYTLRLMGLSDLIWRKVYIFPLKYHHNHQSPKWQYNR